MNYSRNCCRIKRLVQERYSLRGGLNTGLGGHKAEKRKTVQGMDRKMARTTWRNKASIRKVRLTGYSVLIITGEG